MLAQQAFIFSNAQKIALTKAFESADVEKSGKIGCNNVVEILETLIGKGLTENEQEVVKGKSEIRSQSGVLGYADFAAIVAETLEKTTNWGSLTTPVRGYVGIDTLTDQLRRRAVKRGFEFNIMVVGGSGLGKSTLVNTLFKSNVSRKSCAETVDLAKTAPPNGKIPRTTDIRSVSHVVEENGVRLRLTVTDTPGFGDYINNENCWLPIVEYINDQYEKYLSDEIAVARKKNIPDTRVHVVLYFVAPTGHHLKPLDIEFMRRLDKICNVVPVIAKADTLTLDERREFRVRLQQDLEFHNIEVYPPKDLEDDEEDLIVNQKLREIIPFAVCGSDKMYKADGKAVLGRHTNWGVIEIENREHCEFADLRDMLVRTHTVHLVEITDDMHYENFRQERLRIHSIQNDLTLDESQI